MFSGDGSGSNCYYRLMAPGRKYNYLKMETPSKRPGLSFNTHLLALISFRMAQINDCKYCTRFHREALKNMGDSNVRLCLLSIWNEVPCFSGKEKGLLALTEIISGQNTNDPSDGIYQLIPTHFSKNEINKLAFAIRQIEQWTLVMKNYERM